MSRQRAEPYVVALICVAIASLLRLPLSSVLGGTQVWLTFWPAAFLAAWIGGARAGITAVVLSLVIVGAWLLPESKVMTPAASLVGATVFAVCGLGFAYVAELTRRSRRAAIEANRAKDEFLAVLGHELRNPLAPVASAAAIMRMRTPHSRELDVIERQVKHMSRLVDDLLDISRIVRGNIELQRTVNDLAGLIERATEMVKPQSDGHRFELDVPLGVYVDVDAARIVQVLTNVLVNAIKFSPATEPIRIAAQRSGDHVVLTITDHGVGMDEAMVARAFEPFVQGTQTSDRPAGGLGLGLTIARRLVELHGGTLTATSVPGDGTTIEITLPVTRVTPTETAASVPAPVAPRQVGQRILVVDDNQDGAQLLADLLALRGHTVRVAYDGPAALEVLATFDATLALVDIGLPGMDGHELARKIRERGVAVRLVAVTGYGRDTDRERALASGFDEHLVKPLSLSRLEEVIRGLG